MSDPGLTRLETEVELLEAMYPDQTNFNAKSSEFAFSSGTASLLLRLPELYPESGLPDVILATDINKDDLRAQTIAAVKELRLADGEEALDAIIAAFQQVLETNAAQKRFQDSMPTPDGRQLEQYKTVIIWLHHLLNTNKRKLALSPAVSSPPVSGLTKPGYPGILVFSGPSTAVAEHVNTLKAQNWQAFQVRYEEDELWVFAHGTGMREVDSMSDVVKGVGDLHEDSSRGDRQKEEFLKAVGIK